MYFGRTFQRDIFKHSCALQPIQRKVNKISAGGSEAALMLGIRRPQQAVQTDCKFKVIL